MENIKLVDLDRKSDSSIASEPKDSMLSFVLKFQSQLNIEGLLHSYNECVNSIHVITGVRYRYPLLGINHSIGNITRQSHCHFQMENNDEFLGDLTIYHDQTIDKNKLKSIELVSSLLAHPLKNIIQEKSHTLLAGNEETVGIANATLVEQLVTREAKLANRERVPLSLILFDIDRFHRVTQMANNIVRDDILYQVIHVMRSNIRDTDLLFRYENDTYCLILKGVTTKNALVISERIRESIDSYNFKVINKNACHMTVSSGITELVATDSIESIFARATKAMQHAKKMGRNQSIIADGKFIS